MKNIDIFMGIQQHLLPVELQPIGIRDPGATCSPVSWDSQNFMFPPSPIGANSPKKKCIKNMMNKSGSLEARMVCQTPGTISSIIRFYLVHQSGMFEKKHN